MFELSFTYRFEAAHRFTKSCPDSCATPHGHTWRARAELRSTTADLDATDMVVEFARLKGRWKALLDKTLDHSWLTNVSDPILPALTEHIPGLRAVHFPGDPTTELLAALLFVKMEAFLDAEGLAERVTLKAIHIQETETNSVRCVARPPWAAVGVVNGFSGWWSTPDPDDRHCDPA